jgi:NAD(P)-dependent dehydrogenase (short-subunit alcohol dehydrogenase family)
MIYTAEFKDRVALVTGGGSGIGRHTCLAFAQNGARVAVLDSNEQNGLETVELIRAQKGEALFFKCDVSNEEEVRHTLESIVNQFKRLDFAYNNAGIGGEFARVADYPTSDWDLVMNINLKGVFLCMKYEIPAILKTGKGAIVNCASLLSTVTYENDSAYVASKYAVLGLTKNAAVEYAKTSLRINAISPGFTYTPMIMKGDSQKIKNLEEKHAAGRLAQPTEIANGVMWLCSDQSSFCVGHNLLVDGGYTLL